MPDLGTIGQPAAAVGAAATQTRSRLRAMISTASIALPDPVAYRRQWQNYRVRLIFGVPPGDAETRDLAAPKPPPGE